MPLPRTRIYVEPALTAGAGIAVGPEQRGYLANVMRLGAGDEILVFNGRDGEWRGKLAAVGKRDLGIEILERTRAQSGGPEIDYLFAPLKHARLDYMVQKATELGVARLRPVITRRTQAERVKIERMRANAIEAAEQCGVLRLPEVAEADRLERVLDGWPAGLPLVFCDEAAKSSSPLAALSAVPPGPVAVLVGPEGGFDPTEREKLLRMTAVVPLALGPRIMRADTAAIAVLALVNAVLGDWR